jgi:tellurite resistance protein TehA-like permease
LRLQKHRISFEVCTTTHSTHPHTHTVSPFQHQVTREERQHTLTFPGLYTIGLITFLLTLFLFTLFTILLTLRLLLHPTHILGALSHPSESWFLGSFFLSTSVLIGCTQVYGITYGPAYPWLIDAIHVLYWIYAGFSFANSVGQYWVLVARSKVRPVAFTPSMFLAGYSAMLTGTLASLIAPYQDPGRAYLVVLSGLTFQGFGWLVSSTCLVFFVRGLLDTGLPPAKVRPALFIPVGSVSYTIVALVGQANGVPEGIGYFAKHPQAKDTCQVFALMVSVFMYLFSVWLFLLAVLGNISVVGNMQFSLSWWAFIFPNVGFMLATNALGRELESEPILWVASGLTVALVVVWIVAAVGCVRAVWRGEIVWPGKDEDKDL